MTEFLHAAARELWSRSLLPEDRVLVIGASGWFGRTAVGLLDGQPQPRLLIAGHAREISTPIARYRCETWDWSTVSDFAPTVVVDCAFLTRDLVASMPLADYVERNTELTSRLLAVAELGSVRRVITVSSGAAVFPVDALSQPLEANPYGYLKRSAEESLSSLARRRDVSAVIARAWSVSGAFVQKPRSYAFSDLILQASEGAVAITARARVFRRYVGVEDLLAVSLAVPFTRVIESGGELVEMQGLAERIIDVVNPRASLVRAEPDGTPDNLYYAPEESWIAACREADFAPADLDQQIATARNGLLVG